MKKTCHVVSVLLCFVLLFPLFWRPLLQHRFSIHRRSLFCKTKKAFQNCWKKNSILNWLSSSWSAGLFMIVAVILKRTQQKRHCAWNCHFLNSDMFLACPLGHHLSLLLVLLVKNSLPWLHLLTWLKSKLLLCSSLDCSLQFSYSIVV